MLLDMIWTLAVRVPVAVGENWTKKVHVLKPWPAAASCVHGFDRTKSPGFAPVIRIATSAI